MLRDIEDTPTYQRLIKKGIEQGREEGRVEGLEQGRAEGMRQAALDLVLARFPEWRSLARRQLALITDPKVLQQVVIQMGSAKTAREAKEYLLDLEPPESEMDE